MKERYSHLIMVPAEWLYDSESKILATTFVSSLINRNYQFHITAIFGDSWTGMRVGDSAACSAERESTQSSACLYAWLVSHPGVWYDEKGNQQEISNFFDTRYLYSKLVEFGKTIQVRDEKRGISYTVINPWGKTPKLQKTLNGKVSTYTLRYE